MYGQWAYAYKIDYVNHNRWITVEKSNNSTAPLPKGLSLLSLPSGRYKAL